MNTTTMLKTLFAPEDVFEIRILGAVEQNSSWEHTESGYFDYEHIDVIPNLIANFKSYSGVYVTLNPVLPDLLARANNRFKKAKNNSTTSDAEITKRNWVLIDVDPVRPSGISATESEREYALDKAIEIQCGLKTLNFPEPIVVDSGNGTQLLYRVDLPNNSELVKQCLNALSVCSTEHANVDGSVHNAARICRLPGTANRKGDSTKERPHRVAEILEMPEQVEVVPVDVLEKLAASVAEPPKEETFTPTNSPADDYNARGDINSVLLKAGWTLKNESEQQYWWRPSKSSGQHSATFNGEVFYVFSSNAAPFEPNKGYNKFSVYTLLEHGGDFSEAVKCLRVLGYGSDTSHDVGACVDLSGLVVSKDIPKEKIEHGPTVRDVEEVPEPIDSSPELSDPGMLPDKLLAIPGFVNDLMEHTLAVSPYPNRTMAFCGALSMQSYLTARRVKDSMNNRSNLYMVALASSGVGKNKPREVNSELAYEIGLLHGIADSFASGEGVEDAMFTNQAMLFQTDEFDAIIGSIKKSNDSRSEMMMQILLKMFSSATSRYALRKKAGQSEPLVIQQPSLTLYGTAVPQYFYQALSGRMLNNGLFARTLVLDAGVRGRGQKPISKALPESVIEAAKHWADYRPGSIRGGNLNSFYPEPATIDDTEIAAKRSDEIWALTDDAYEKAQLNNDETQMAIWARAFEKTRKLALLYACSENYQEPIVTENAINWAWQVVEHQTKKMLFMASLYVSDSEFQADCKRFIKFLTKYKQRKGKESFMPHWDLARRLDWPEKKIQLVRESLVAQERIEVKQTIRGPLSLQYRLL